MLISKALCIAVVALLLAEGAAPTATPKAERPAINSTQVAKSTATVTNPSTLAAQAPQKAPAASKSAPVSAGARLAPVTTRAVPIATAFQLHWIETAVVDQTNRERARHGLPPLVVDQRLVQSARAHTAWMSRSRRMQHTSRPVAENIAMGQRSAGEVVQSWMNSSGHRANILNRGHGRIGVAAYSSADGAVYWTQQFEP